MPKQDPYGFSIGNVLFEAEVAPTVQAAFQARYYKATGINITPGNPPEFQRQPNKWGAECRIYFNSDDAAKQASSKEIHVEGGRPYHDNYQYRINNVDLWWELVEEFDFRLGFN
ncbi:MAG: hypothetical protein J0652_04980 [Desulfobulbaceae bacterium]|nr:hypothetical protein [Desulfobulbaceae bacterium]